MSINHQSDQMNARLKLLEPDIHVAACRICGAETFPVIDLGFHPLANKLVASPSEPVATFPLALHVCASCATAQLSYCVDAKELYEDYMYMTPASAALAQHYEAVLDFLEEEGYLQPAARVLEVGSNVGHFLTHLQNRGATILGIDPAVNIAAIAAQNGIPTVTDFFNRVSAQRILAENGAMNMVVARHCFAHNEKPWLMVEGVQQVLKDDGFFIIENAYFFDTVAGFEFDQIYHEHMYYHSVRSIDTIVKRYGMTLVDVYHSPIHGGSMVYVVKKDALDSPVNPRVTAALEREREMHTPAYYKDFGAKIAQNRQAARDLISRLRAEGKTIHAYGASAKSTTLLNYYGLTREEIPVIIDSSPTKHHKYIPLANIAVISEEEGLAQRPDYYLLTIWNYKDEVIRKVRDAGNVTSKFILPHPQVEILG